MRSKVSLMAFCALAAAVAAGAQQSPEWGWSSGLGVALVPMTPALRADLALTVDKGILILATARGGPADQATMKPGDVIVALSDREALSEEGKDATLQFVHDGSILTRGVHSGAIPYDTVENLTWPEHAAQRAKTLRVDPEGAGDFRTLTGALHRAAPGDTVELHSGTYAESVFVPPGIVLHAAEESSVEVRTGRQSCMVGPGTVEIAGISFAGGGLRIAKADRVDLTSDTFESSEKQVGLVLLSCKNVRVSKSTFTGAVGTVGIAASGSDIVVNQSVFTNNGDSAIKADGHCGLELTGNLMNGNGGGVVASECNLVAHDNVITGTWTPDGKESPGAGLACRSCTAWLTGNSIRRQLFGVSIQSATAPVTVSDNTITQGLHAVLLRDSAALVGGNLLMHNAGDGVIVVPAEKTTRSSTLEVTIARNTISENEGVGIDAGRFDHVTASTNLLEANNVGVQLARTTASIENNTVVLQRGAGINVMAGSDASIFNNIVTFNGFGIVVDASAHRESGYNDVYGNLANTEFPLRDGNYARVDRYTAVDGRKVFIEVFPAYDVGASTDVSIDPGFVKLGSDYTLKKDAPLSMVRGRGERYLGAYAPAPPIDYVEQTADGLYQQAEAYYTAGDKAEAAASYRKAAVRGHADAQYKLALMYISEEGGLKDSGSAEARSWLIKAADQGHAAAQDTLGNLYEEGGGPNEGSAEDQAEAGKWYRKAAEHGYAPAQLDLATWYLGDYTGVTAEEGRAMWLLWLQKAAQGGSSDAQAVLGGAYMTGNGVPKDLVNAYMWCSLASGNASDEERVALCLSELKAAMTQEQLGDAERRIETWKASHPQAQK